MKFSGRTEEMLPQGSLKGQVAGAGRHTVGYFVPEWNNGVEETCAMLGRANSLLEEGSAVGMDPGRPGVGLEHRGGNERGTTQNPITEAQLLAEPPGLKGWPLQGVP